MAKTNEDNSAGRQRMDAGELAPWVAEFTRRLRQLGYTSLTVRSYDDAGRHLAHWLLKARVAVADIDEAVIDRFARHRCQCPGCRSEKHVSGKYVRRVRRFIEFLGERGPGARPTRGRVPGMAATASRHHRNTICTEIKRT